MYKKHSKNGLQIISVNNGDSVAVIRKFTKQIGATFPTLLNGSGKNDVTELYKVSSYPTNYVLDSKGKIAASFVGFDESGLKAALAKLGIKD